MTELPRTGLPIEPFLPEIAARLAERGALVLAAEPGAGKTSLVPPSLLGRVAGRILVLEPRRVAAVAAAERIAELAGAAVGGLVGYRVRSESKSSSATRILTMTEGVLVRMIQDDPSLAEVGLVVFDEFHERSLQADLGLALALEARALRPELGILVMSATLDTRRLAARLEAPVVEVPGRAHPVTTRHAPTREGPGFEDALAALAAEVSAELGAGSLGAGSLGGEGRAGGEARDLLVFLPGAAEIARCGRALAGCGAEALALHGSLSLAEQRRVLAPRSGEGRRIVLATSLAETSLTVPRIGAVLDSGLARVSRFHARSGLNRLVTEREAADRADQRRGRAGRLGPGLCVRAWPASETLPARTEAEILRAELSGLVLESLLWGARGRGALPWLDEPPAAAWEAGLELLGELGALDPDGGVGEFGRRMASLGTEPRLAALVLRGAEAGRGWEAALLAALLSEREGSGRDDSGGDLELGLERLASGEAGLGRTMIEARRLARAAGIGPEERPRSGGAGRLLAAAFPDRIARRQEARGPARRPDSSPFQLFTGRLVAARGALARSPWIVAVDADAGTDLGRVYSGAALTEAEALVALAPSTRVVTELEWTGMRCRCRRIKQAGALILSETAVGPLSKEEAGEALARRVEEEGLGILPWEADGAGELLRRLRWWTSRRSARAEEPGLRFDEASLMAAPREWLLPFVQAGPGELLDGRALRLALEALVPFALRGELERGAPARLRLPSGASRPIRYEAGSQPSVESRVQDFFGLDSQPRAGGEPLLLRLLSPAGRPIQVTSDLPGFWRGSWAEVRKELRGRYPKHHWPENPADLGSAGLPPGRSWLS
ncbi:MAG TPA: ATP-dependent helicase HrpB [Rectinemataceae bacterium]|nr:ATP-dependent helicase HrpB [Rectinemataceae bacterium]